MVGKVIVKRSGGYNPSVTRKASLRKEISELRSIGGLMSNVCFNLGQKYDPKLAAGARHVIDNHDLGTMADLRVQWDAIKRAEVAK